MGPRKRTKGTTHPDLDLEEPSRAYAFRASAVEGGAMTYTWEFPITVCRGLRLRVVDDEVYAAHRPRVEYETW